MKSTIFCSFVMFCAKFSTEDMESSPSSSTITTKTERRIIEKNRRIHMKALYSKLHSLLPDHSPKEGLPLPDQIDEAIKYIKILENKLEKSKEKKEKLVSRKRSYSCTSTSGLNSTLNSPQIQIIKMGPDLDVVFITGLDDLFIFYEMIRMIHEEGAEVVNASLSVAGNAILHLLRPKIGESAFNFGAATISERLKVLVHGNTSEVESQHDLWDFDIQPDTWEFEIPQVMHMGI